MKRLAFLLLLLLFSAAAEADTISHWTVRLHGKVIGVFNESCPGRLSDCSVLRLKRADIQKGDSLIIDYICDTPCPDCTCWIKLTLKQHEQSPVVSVQPCVCGPVAFPLDAFLEDRGWDGRVFFTRLSSADASPSDWLETAYNSFLFQLILE